MKKLIILFALISHFALNAQKTPDLRYYLPDENYNSSIPTPAEVLGFEIGERHVSHDQMVRYVEKITAASGRMSLEIYGRTFEKRPLMLIKITSEARQGQLEDIRQKRKEAILNGSDLSDFPAVVYQGYSVHGNEASGGNAALLMLYYLAASENPEVKEWLENNIILLDPCFNPDGFNRFSSWVNSHRSQVEVSDPNHREFDEEWPGGRTNHYWFDVNRDWLPVQLPESKGRLVNFQKWLPNVLTDHHEMGTYSTFFFQPGIESRTNPNTPDNNEMLTAKIATYHADALDSIGSLYYSKESYDDFYYGKGSTYPDINGAVGILFEQASSRGSAQESPHGVLRFPFTVRNQVVTSFSTLRAANALRIQLLEHQQQFYAESKVMASQEEYPATLIKADDGHRLKAFTEILDVHEITYFSMSEAGYRSDGIDFNRENAIVVPHDQRQYRLFKIMTEDVTSFEDSLFYDISAWSFLHSFHLESAPFKGRRVEDYTAEKNSFYPDTSYPEYQEGIVAFIIPWKTYYSSGVVYELQEAGLRLKVSNREIDFGISKIYRGDIIIPIQSQELKGKALYDLIREKASKHNVSFFYTNSYSPLGAPFESLEKTGPYLGSRNIEPLEQPRIALLVGSGVSAYDAGEVWHLLDERMKIPVTLLETSDVNAGTLSRYNVLIMVDGSYRINKDVLSNWISEGNTIIAYEDAARSLAMTGITDVQFKSQQEQQTSSEENYENMELFDGAQVIGGTIFAAKGDLTHPLLYGYSRKQFPVFRSHTLYMEMAENPRSNPLSYAADPLISGYISDEQLAQIRNTAAIDVSGVGRGRVISFMDNTNFRAFWWGTNKLLMNAIFFGSTLDYGTTR